tara:strand:+ start:1720 stop:1941 length:222 start_codon:yes stop_codon:yes gene_type:complete
MDINKLKLNDMKKCNYVKTGEAIIMASYDVRQEYKTDCGIRHVNMQERVWNGIEPIRIKPKGNCIYCKKEIAF